MPQIAINMEKINKYIIIFEFCQLRKDAYIVKKLFELKFLFNLEQNTYFHNIYLLTALL